MVHTADEPPAPPAARRALSVLVPDDLELLDIAISPDGQRLAYTAIRDGRARLYVRSLDRFEAVEVRHGGRRAAVLLT